MDYKTCSLDNCNRQLKAQGLCNAHYKRLLRGNPLDKPLRKGNELKTCSVDGCLNVHEAKGYCSRHLQRFYDGVALTSEWRGYGINRRINHLGYSMICGPGISKPSQYVLEHRYLMEQFLERKLNRNENIHHKNGVRSDNRLENLELWTTQQPSGQRVEDKISWAKDFLEKHGYVVHENPELLNAR